MDYYYLIFFALISLVVLAKRTGGGASGQGAFQQVISLFAPSAKEGNYSFLRLQRNYLSVFYLYKLSDWLMGPYFYDVYASKELSNSSISRLFLVGFGSSMVVGTLSGGLVDKIGRKAGCLLFAVLYVFSALSVHSSDYTVLAGGRVCGGIATSLLMSAPEAWIGAQVAAGQHDPSLLEGLFGWQYFGDSIVAIIAGVFASFLAESYGPTAPFDASIVVLCVSFVLTQLLWTEPKASSSSSSASTSSTSSTSSSSSSSEGKSGSSYSRGLTLLLTDSRLLRLGLVQSCFEAAMYVFVLQWVPLIRGTCTDGGVACPPPLGFTFSCLMAASMLGTTLFGIFMGRAAGSLATGLAVVCAVASVSLLTAALVPLSTLPSLGLLLVFEACVGFYFPAISCLRAPLLPDDLKATILNYFRLPLNLLVVSVFLSIDSLGSTGALTTAGTLLLVAAGLQLSLSQEKNSKQK